MFEYKTLNINIVLMISLCVITSVVECQCGLYKNEYLKKIYVLNNS